MTATYQKPITIPDDFPAILKAFTREILRAQPSNIYEFGARYFVGLQGQPEADGRAAAPEASTSSAKGPMDMEETATMFDIANLTSAELEPILMRAESRPRAATQPSGNGEGWWSQGGGARR
ncbi:hypothetical protein TSOC_007528 [Tetrabaena socialis]|uniref:RIIa domain-containing protein n=1 Tax=Tetrabaena socialis TaxID=47790 RepID=A0A2J8A0U8_9CHLO|nr:hypothetical protein TSOC_007528 [Tetrabaena socialis]|eukprot:PNH06142.1 hypothetical protein TSOC_007528 [Tetrabaena socialis]